jgi:DNA-binding transcriptional MerR regulator
MEQYHLYSIGHVSAQTGLPPYLIRVWESRYSAVSPLRSSGNRRIFCANDIKKLQLLSKAVEKGHIISQIASLSHEELVKVIGSRLSEDRDSAKDGKVVLTDVEPYFRRSLQLVTELNIDGLQSTLDEAAINLTRPVLILDLIVPLYFRTKRLVETDNLRSINLKAVTSFLQSLMWDLLRTTVVTELAPKIVTGTLTGQRNEIGALALALIAVESGYKAIHLGLNLPANDLAAVLKSKAAQAVAVFVEDYESKNYLRSELSILQNKLGDDFLILVCAHEKLNTSDLVKHGGIYVTTLKNFRQILETLTIEKMI